MTDRFTIRAVVLALAVGVIVGLGLMGWLASTQTPIPDSLDRLVFLLAGGLVGVLASTRSSDEVQQVVGPEGGPVPVTDDGERGAVDALTAVIILFILVLIVLLVRGGI